MNHSLCLPHDEYSFLRPDFADLNGTQQQQDLRSANVGPEDSVGSLGWIALVGPLLLQLALDWCLSGRSLLRVDEQNLVSCKQILESALSSLVFPSCPHTYICSFNRSREKVV